MFYRKPRKRRNPQQFRNESAEVRVESLEKRELMTIAPASPATGDHVINGNKSIDQLSLGTGKPTTDSTPLPGVGTLSQSRALDGTLYALGSNNTLYRFVGSVTGWAAISGNDVVSFGVAPDGNLYALNTGHTVFRYKGPSGNPRGPGYDWEAISYGDVNSLTVAPDGRVLALNFDKVIIQYKGPGIAWTALSGNDVTSFLVTSGNNIYALNTAKTVFRYKGPQHDPRGPGYDWQAISGNDVVSFNVAADGNLYALNTSHIIFRYRGAGTDPRGPGYDWAALGAPILSSGTLSIQGSDGSDIIRVWQGGTQIFVDGIAGCLTGSWDATLVSSIQVNALGGNDVVENHTKLAMTAIGGAGDDMLIGGAGDDILDGGIGNDSLIGGYGNDTYQFSPIGPVSEVDLIVEPGGSDATGCDTLDFSRLQSDVTVDLDKPGVVATHAGRTVKWTAQGGIEIVLGGHGNDTIWGSDFGSERLEGNDGNDVLHGRALNDKLFGGQGRDTLYGESGEDILNGGDDNDTLYGGSGNDQLFGGDWIDTLYGEDGNDWLEAGSASEFADGGNGDDWNAHQWVIGSAEADDVDQNQSGTCWFLAAISAVAYQQRGINSGYVPPIRYLGNFRYEVTLFQDTRGTPDVRVVEFSGTTFASDPRQVAEGESWVLLMNRACLQIKGIDPANPGAPTAAGDTLARGLTMVTGRPGGYHKFQNSTPDNSVIREIRDALGNGHFVTAGTIKDAPATVGNHYPVVFQHAYAVVGVYDNGDLRLRNPWGLDGGWLEDDDPNDGYVRISLSDFQTYFDGYYVALRSGTNRV